MCGICGIYSEQPIDRVVIQRMNDTISHRGPDDEGVYLASDNSGHFIALANRRLSILDLSTAGHQPMFNEDKTIWITYNGEIYNYVELRNELIKLGHRFQSDADTEVIIHSYEQWGVECLKHFNGMWAFAIWDGNKKQLFCARDYFGIKPFYYYYDNGNFIFASEIKSIITHPAVKRGVNEEILYDYLTTGFVDHTENTFFAGIKQLRPAHYLIINRGNNPQIVRWWDITLGNGKKKDDAGVIEQFRDLLEDSVSLRLRSDVPVGTCLSGGLDSSSIVCLTNRLLLQNRIVKPELIGTHQKTFSACYDDTRVDERRFIDSVISQTSAESHLTFPDAQGLWADIERMVYHQEEPFRSTSIYAQYCVMKLTAQNGVKVLLDGQGADELLAGYFSYPPVFITQLITEGNLIRAYQEWQKGIFASNTQQRAKTALFILHNLMPGWLRRLGRNVSGFLSPEKSFFRTTPLGVRPEWASKFGGRLNYLHEHRFRQSRNLNQMLYTEICEYSLPALLRYEDKNSSAFSIEARVPFLDHRLMEFIFSLGPEYKIKDGWTKWLLRESMKETIPSEIAWRRDKIGFNTPEIQWLRANRDNILSLFKNSTTISAEFINPQLISRRIEGELSKDEITVTNLWRWVNLEIWLKVIFA